MKEPTVLLVAPAGTSKPSASGYAAYGYRVNTIIVYDREHLSEPELAWLNSSILCRLAPGGRVIEVEP